MTPTDRDWDMMVTAQEAAEIARKADNLRLPRNPQYALKALEGRLSEIASKRPMPKGRVSCVFTLYQRV